MNIAEFENFTTGTYASHVILMYTKRMIGCPEFFNFRMLPIFVSTAIEAVPATKYKPPTKLVNSSISKYWSYGTLHFYLVQQYKHHANNEHV
jgi:hypothetical protein